MSSESTKTTTRRQFLGQTAGTVAGASLAGAATRCTRGAANGPGRRAASLGANDRIRLGFIGCGMQFQDLLRRGFLPRRERQGDVEFVEVCDVWQPRVDNAKAKTGAERGGRDYRVLLDCARHRRRRDRRARSPALHDRARGAARRQGRVPREADDLHHRRGRETARRGAADRAHAAGGRFRPELAAAPEAARVRAGRQDGQGGVGVHQLQPQHDRGHVGLPDPRHRQRGLARRTGHAREPRLAGVAGRRPQTPVQQGALLPVAQVLGLLGRQRYRPAVPPPRRPQRHRRLRLPDARRQRWRHLRARRIARSPTRT